MSLCAKVAQNPNISYVTYSGNKQVCVRRLFEYLSVHLSYKAVITVLNMSNID